MDSKVGRELSVPDPHGEAKQIFYIDAPFYFLSLISVQESSFRFTVSRLDRAPTEGTLAPESLECRGFTVG